ncbi:MAG: hypothetical protein VKK04_06255 [Synechococcales bacterium]|nr:hypothetical protein [Synechococcales bacterium]
MQKPLGSRIDMFEWLVRFPVLLNQFANGVEDLYERGPGSRPATFGGSYHNLAVWGFKVVDSFSIHSEYCDRAINREEGWLEDDFVGLPSGAMYRTAKRVLNPRFEANRATWTQVTNLKAIVEKEQTVDALILWLGSNDCLGTVVDLQLKDMTDADVEELERTGQLNDPITRRKWNLTNLNLFERDFAFLVDAIAAILPATTKVFVGTVPYVTIPPITQGLGSFDGRYFDYYGPFFANAENYRENPPGKRHLSRDDVATIDQRIDGFNDIIRRLVAAQGQQWTVVEIGSVLGQLAVKRNRQSDTPELPLIERYRDKGWDDHPLLQLEPVPSVLRYGTKDAVRIQGGLFSLDSVHPTTIGYGIVAEEFLAAMQAAGVEGADPRQLDWPGIIAQDTLIQSPPVLWDDIVSAAENNAALWNLLLSFAS